MKDRTTELKFCAVIKNKNDILRFECATAEQNGKELQDVYVYLCT